MAGLVVAIFVKGCFHKSVIESLDDVVPVGVGGGGVIKDTRVPFISARESHGVIHSIPCQYELHLEVRKSVNNVQWDHVTVVSTEYIEYRQTS
jgi:hypothetical protein